MIEVLTAKPEDHRLMATPAPPLTRSTMLRTSDEPFADIDSRITSLLRTVPTSAEAFLVLEQDAMRLGAVLVQRERDSGLKS